MNTTLIKLAEDTKVSRSMNTSEDREITQRDLERSETGEENKLIQREVETWEKMMPDETKGSSPSLH